jgi:RimJ/RimL family protein N-acetyltransferase
MSDPAPLYGLRLRTPRLELRLGSPEEIEELGRLAEQGIHPPEEMPFAVAWSDRLGEPGFLDSFVAHHRGPLEDWDVTAWMLNLLVRAGGQLAGSQSVGVDDREPGRVVTTGSWLGASFQGRGIGTEMRAAVLELAFRCLDAEAATSAWLEGNATSRRVSEKLGYRETHRRLGYPREHWSSATRSGWSEPAGDARSRSRSKASTAVAACSTSSRARAAPRRATGAARAPVRTGRLPGRPGRAPRPL